jgi:hypothetical protein
MPNILPRAVARVKMKELKSRIYDQIAKYLTADNSVLQNSNTNDMRVMFSNFIFSISTLNLLIVNVMQLILVKLSGILSKNI